MQKIEDNWSEWVTKIKVTGIYQKWVAAGYRDSADGCARHILAAAMWGWGIENWQLDVTLPIKWVQEEIGAEPSDARLHGGFPEEFWYLDNWLLELCHR